ncbi:MAG TPA: glycosyl hydrolase [Candidatus Dormibacteraeota bacterium]|nr:glycosyl hydrolase [Candidatus Dormibacteraeota bacterium]
MSTSGQPPPKQREAAARLDWERRVGHRRDSVAAAIAEELLAPDDVRAEAGGGQVTLRWSLVKGAAGYVVQRSERPDGPFTTIDHGGGDVLAVPGPCYADTTGRPGVDAWYAVASLTSADGTHGPLSPGVRAKATTRPGAVEVTVHAGAVLRPLVRPWHMVGSEHLTQLFYGRNDDGFDVGEEFAQAFRIAHEELGVNRVRAHGILMDDLGVYSEPDGRPAYDFAGVDRVYDRLLALGLRPVVELSFMPRALARDPRATVFDYRAIISPPKDWGRWRGLVGALAQHLVDRYGIAEVADWGFEVWNEPNLEVFWSSSRQEYFRLYDEAAAAIKAVDARLKVGGPATAAAGWIADFAAHVIESGAAVDFLATHTYGNLPLDVAATAMDVGLGPRPVWWTEWGVSPRHFAPINDSVLGGPFVLHGMFSAMDRAEHLAYWVISDHFEELGRPPRLLHGGFGLLAVGNLRKPRYWALRMLEMLGRDRLVVDVNGDGAESLVQAIATSSPDGAIHAVVWNGTLDQSKQDGAALLDRNVRLRFSGLGAARYRREHWRLDREHSNIARHWPAAGSPDWPDAQSWARLRQADRLDALVPPGMVAAERGNAVLEFPLPMPGASLIQLVPET